MTATLNWYRALDIAGVGQLGPVAVPTTYLWGTEDVGASRAAAARCGEHVTAPFRFVELPGLSH